MSTIDIPGLLSPRSAEAPSGPNLEDEADFLALEQAAQGSPERQVGDEVIEAEPPNFMELQSQSVALLQRSLDLRVAFQCARALMNLQQVGGLQAGLALIRGALENHWETVHPELDAEDDDDPMMRVSALGQMDTAPFIDELRSLPLLQPRGFGTITLSSVAGAGASDAEVDTAEIAGAFREAGDERVNELFDQLGQCAEDVSAIETVFQERGAGGMLKFRLLTTLLKQARAEVGKHRTEPPPEQSDGSEGEGGEDQASESGPRLTGTVRSREDVIRSIDLICTYYARYEPSSPLPLLLERCKRLVDKSFMEIIEDLAPDGVSQVESVVGKPTEK